MLFDERSFCADGFWYLVHCHPKKEAYAARSLRQLFSLPVFLPENQVRLRGEIKYTPFFPGYLFACADLQKVSLSALNACPGVLRLVGFGRDPQPVPVPYAAIKTIEQQLLQMQGKSIPPAYTFNPGDAVRVKFGTLQDLNMMFVGAAGPNHRVHVLLEFMGRLTDAQVDVETLERAPENGLHVSFPLAWSKPRVRYTRGKGRKIRCRPERNC